MTMSRTWMAAQRPPGGRDAAFVESHCQSTGRRLELEVSQKIAQRAAKGETPYAIAKSLGIDRHTAAKYVGCAAAAR
jgi:hypothetical protein